MTPPTDDQTPTDDRMKSGRTAKGTFAPGNAGGPGRRPGRGPAADIRAALGADLDAIIATVRAAAIAGDMAAARLILDRVAPSLKAEELPRPLELPDGNLTKKGQAILAAAAAGDISPTQAAAMIGAIGTLARVVEIDELAARVTALEDRRAKS